MNSRVIILFAYFLLTLLVGMFFRKKAERNRLEFILAGRSLTNLPLFFTMAATNFSAFTIFGFSGAGYRMGYSFYPVMGFGTGFMAISFFIIGSKISILSRRRNYIIPSDFIFDRYNSPFLKKLFSAVMIIFTLPYLSIQAIASGKSLNSLMGLPYLWGAFLVTAFIVTYVAFGGMRSIVWTDLLQGIMIISFTLTAFIIISGKSGGFISAHKEIQGSFPSLFSRPGQDNAMPYGIWFGYMFLWFFADPMFPQLFQRFIAAKDEKALRATIVLYPIITTFLFFLTVSIGVIGRLTFPDLAPGASDTIFPLLLVKYTGTFLSTLLLTGSIAALMSTMDSQLLTLSSMITTDFLKIKRNVVFKERLTIVILGILGLLIALKPPPTILDFIRQTTFNGLSVLAPTVLGGLYWKKANKNGAALSIIFGEAMVVGYYFNLIHLPGILPVVPIMIVTAAVFMATSLLTSSIDENMSIVFGIKKISLKWVPVFIILFVLGNDFWAWGREPVMIAGLPLWIWYYFGLGMLLSLAFSLFIRSTEKAG